MNLMGKEIMWPERSKPLKRRIEERKLIGDGRRGRKSIQQNASAKLKLSPNMMICANVIFDGAFLHAYLVQLPLSISPSAKNAPFDLDLSVSVKLWRPLLYISQ